jgi:hypothetical protein
MSSALIVGTLVPVIGYGSTLLVFPVFLLFGCDSAQSGGDCLRILMTPFLPFVLTIIAVVGCRLAIGRKLYLASVLGAALACGASWLAVFGSWR